MTPRRTAGALLALVALPAHAQIITGGSNPIAGAISVASRVPKATDDYTAGYFPPNAISSLYISTAGVACTGTPTLAIGAPGAGGVQATGHFVLNSAGGTVGAVVDNPGANYTSNPTVTVTNSGCTTAPVVAASYSPVGAFWNSPVGMYQMQQGVAGAAVWNTYPVNNLPLDSVANPVTAATVVSGGTGYAVNDTITLINGTVIKVLTVSGGVIQTTSITTAGNWPCGGTSVQGTTQTQQATSGSGTGATFTVTIASSTVAYGTKLLTQCYSGNAFQVTRASDSAVLTVGFVNRVADISTMRQFCAGTTCTYTRVYDQSGFGNDIVAGTPAIFDANWIMGGAPSFFINGQMTIPTTASFGSESVSIFELRQDLAYGSSGTYDYLAGSYRLATNYKLTLVTDGFTVNTSLIPSEAPELTGVVGASASNVVVSQQDQETYCTANCTGLGSFTGGYIGYGGSTAAVGAFTAASRAYSATERATFRAAMYALYNMTPQVRDVLLVSGDSRTLGLNSTNLVNYPFQLNKVTPVPLRLYNTGLSGDTSTGRVTNFYTQDVPPFLQPHGKNMWIILWIGYNDFAANSTPAAIYSNITTYITDAHAIGWKVALSTETEGSGTGGSYTGLNTLITANTAGADAVITQMAADPVWQNPSAAPQTFWTAPHPTTFGYGYVAQDMAAGFNPNLH